MKFSCQSGHFLRSPINHFSDFYKAEQFSLIFFAPTCEVSHVDAVYMRACPPPKLGAGRSRIALLRRGDWLSARSARTDRTSCLWRGLCRQTTRCRIGGDVRLAQTPLKQLRESRMILDQAVDQIIVLFQRDQLKRRSPVDRHHHRFIVTKLCVTAQFGLSFTQWNDLHVQ